MPSVQMPCRGAERVGFGAFRGRMRLGLVASLFALLLAGPAVAASYTDVFGTDFSFTGITESSSYGDPEPLFDQPLGAGNQLLFFPPNFAAESTDGGVDSTGSQLQVLITATSVNKTIDSILIDEFGDTLLSGIGTAATGTFISMSGFLTVTADIDGPIGPVVIPWSGVFTPTDTLTLPGDSGTTLWSGSALIDVASSVPNATVAMLSFDNDMVAASEAGTTAKIQKKVVSGPAVVITVIPEPGTVALLGGGLLALALYRRRPTR